MSILMVFERKCSTHVSNINEDGGRGGRAVWKCWVKEGDENGVLQREMKKDKGWMRRGDG